ncbi:MAG: BrnT family toxin [Gammaproteobacteria bacterium]|nr:BrnT family toxin [Gammaproteobacteria bacterium]
MVEGRYIIVGRSERGRLLMVAHADRNNEIRIISARELTRTERRQYEERTS